MDLKRTILKFVGGMLAVTLLAAGAAAAVVWYWAGTASSEIAAIPREQIRSIDPPPPPTEPRNFLVIGSDSRSDLPEGERDHFGDFEGDRADVIMLVRMVPDRHRVRVLSIPRDLKADIPGHGVRKINAAHDLGGPDLMVQAVEMATGIPVHHFVEVDFAGFAGIVDALGGVDLHFEHPARDAKSGLDVPAGDVHLDGPEALAFARSRHYEERREGGWRHVDADDLGRIERQHRLILAILEQAQRPSSVIRMGRLIETLGRHVKTDEGLTSRLMLGLAWELRRVDDGDVRAAMLPVDFSDEQGVAYVVPSEPCASRVLQTFLARPASSGSEPDSGCDEAFA